MTLEASALKSATYPVLSASVVIGIMNIDEVSRLETCQQVSLDTCILQRILFMTRSDNDLFTFLFLNTP